jgi:hypothetical protein
MSLFQIFKIQVLTTIKVSPFFWTRIFLVYSRQAGDYYPFAGTPSLEPKHETYTGDPDPDNHPASRWSIGSHLWV